MIADRYQETGNATGGGMGEVLECTDIRLKRKVIVKKLRLGQENRRLIDEQTALLELRSKHVVQLFDIVTMDAPPVPALVLEHIDGVNLDEIPFPGIDKHLKILWQIACGLADIHLADIIHRDIKPNNIRLDREGVVKIFDFGLSRLRNHAKTETIIGTLGFMAPELWGSPTIAFDSSIDVYAFGMTCLKLAHVSAPKELMEKPPQAFPTGAVAASLSLYPPALANLIEKCFSREPGNRPKMSDIQEALSRYILKDKHRALLVLNEKPHYISAEKRTTTVSFGETALTIFYDGFHFYVEGLKGSVDINNTPLKVGSVLDGCGVLTLNSAASRDFVTFDVSNPEVMP